MTKPRFIHLRVHTEHSLLEGAVPVKKLIKLVKAADIPAVAVTDTNNMFAALEFSVTALAEGVQPIMGGQIAVAYEVAGQGEKVKAAAPVVLLAQTEAGSPVKTDSVVPTRVFSCQGRTKTARRSRGDST